MTKKDINIVPVEVIEKIKFLKDLYEQGQITKETFEKEKNEILLALDQKTEKGTLVRDISVQNVKASALTKKEDNTKRNESVPETIITKKKFRQEAMQKKRSESISAHLRKKEEKEQRRAEKKNKTRSQFKEVKDLLIKLKKLISSKIAKGVLAGIGVIGVALIVIFVEVIPQSRVNEAFSSIIEYIEVHDYVSAGKVLNNIELEFPKRAKATRYEKAISLIESKSYDSAYFLLRDFSWKDSEELLSSMMTTWKKDLKDKVFEGTGVNLILGKYEQDGDADNGREDILWRVIDREGDNVLLISEYVLTQRNFVAITWENSALRLWLNGDFYEDSFDKNEKSAIYVTTVEADENPKYITKPENTTAEKVFILSITEAENYFFNNKARIAGAAIEYKGYAALAALDYNPVRNMNWWLRTAGPNSGCHAYVYSSGEIEYFGAYSSTRDIKGVRPAIWVDLRKLDY